MKRAWPWALAIFAASPSHAADRPFAVRSTADGFVLHGQVDLPSGRPKAVVVMYQGSGNHSRDYDFSVPGSPERSFLFQDLRRRLNAAGIATVRFDERGLRCPGIAADWKPECHDLAAVSTINMATLLGDAEAIYRRAKSVEGGRCLIALGHSEGFYHLARLVGSGARPAGVIGIAGPLSSLRDVVRWQQVDRAPESIAASDLDRDGRVTEQEMKANLANTPLGRRKYEDLQWPPGFVWPDSGMTKGDIAALRALLIKQYDRTRAEVLAKPQTEVFTIPLGNDGKRAASYGWYRSFFIEETPVASYLSSYTRPILLFYGTRDSQLDIARELAVGRKALGKTRLRTSIGVGLGHSLGTHPTNAPMRDDQQQAIVAAAVEIAQRCKRG